MATILILNGPNLNLLGTREPHIYGTTTLAELQERLQQKGQMLGHRMICQQFNSEGDLIDCIQDSAARVDYIIINAGAYSHTSIALRDVLLAVKIPFTEVHLSNIFARETFRHHSVLADRAVGCLSGFGVLGYELALDAAHHYLQNKHLFSH